MQYKLFEPKDNAEGQLDSNIGASTLTIALETGDGAAFPAIYTGTTTSGGTSTLMNKTGISGSAIEVGDFIENITDGSHAYVLSIAANSLTTTSLSGGSDNTWQNGDTYAVNRFIITLNKRDVDGNITASEKVLIDNRSTDILTVNASGRGYDGSVAQAFDASDYANVFITALHISEHIKAFAEVQEMLDLRYTKTAVDALLAARNWKDAVVVATTANGTLATAFENGDTVDGVVLVTGDRILLKDQSSTLENGIYTVNASGAPTRATDFDAAAEVYGSAVAIKKGNSNADTVWLCTSDNPTVGVDPIAFAQVGVTLTKASQAEAQAGTNDTKYMTPSKTWDSILQAERVELGTLGETIASGDLTGQANLVYQLPTDKKWYKVTSSSTTWMKYRLGLALQEGVLNDVVRILLEGLYASQTYANVNPTFAQNGTGTDHSVGQTVGVTERAYMIVNSGAEAICTQITVRLKHSGSTPAGAFRASLVLGKHDNNNNYKSAQEQPCTWRDTTGNRMRGAIIAEGTQAAAGVTNSYANYVISFGGNIKIPAGADVFVVFSMDAAAGANYFLVDSNATSNNSWSLSSGTAVSTWNANGNQGNFTLGMTSTSPIGYAVKAYTGTNGTYGLTPTNPWSPPIGIVTSDTEFYFDPNHIKNMWRGITGWTLQALSTAGGLSTITTNFCPREVWVDGEHYVDATTDLSGTYKGLVNASIVETASGQSGGTFPLGSSPVYALASSSPSPNIGNAAACKTWTPIPATTSDLLDVGVPALGQYTITPTSNSKSTGQNLYCVRLESGFYLFNGIVNGTGFISNGISGFTDSNHLFDLQAFA